jgi:hypothetical protein
VIEESRLTAAALLLGRFLTSFGVSLVVSRVVSAKLFVFCPPQCKLIKTAFAHRVYGVFI